jgi:hypothetical protein
MNLRNKPGNVLTTWHWGTFVKTLLQWKNHWVLHILSVCVCSLRYPACNAHVPRCHLWLGQLYNISTHFRGKKVTGQNMCVLISSTTFVGNISHSKKNSEIWSKLGLHLKCPLFLSDFDETWNFSTDFRKNTRKSNFMKIRPVGAEFFHADGRTDIQTWRSQQSIFAVFRKHLNCIGQDIWNTNGLASGLRMAGLHASTDTGMTSNRPWCNRNKKLKPQYFTVFSYKKHCRPSDHHTVNSITQRVSFL